MEFHNYKKLLERSMLCILVVSLRAADDMKANTKINDRNNYFQREDIIRRAQALEHKGDYFVKESNFKKAFEAYQQAALLFEYVYEHAPSTTYPNLDMKNYYSPEYYILNMFERKFNEFKQRYSF